MSRSMLRSTSRTACGTVFGADEWETWLDDRARAIFGMSGSEFEAAYASGQLDDSGAARDLGSMIPLIARIRRRTAATHACS